jgi:hypothetical protein
VDRTAACSWLIVEHDGDTVRVRTSEALVARRRLRLRALGVAAAVAGLALLTMSAWALALVASAVGAVVLAPLVYRQSDLLEIDLSLDRLTVLQFAAGRGQTIRPSRLRRVCGAYEIYGWDPRSTVYAETDDGARVPILVFVGTHDDLAEAACELVGRLVGVEATYTGSYGPPILCYTPECRPDEAAR